MPVRPSFASLEEHELEARALTGERGSWGELARRHTRRVVVSLLAQGAPLEQAEDIVQEVWIKLMRHQQEGRLARLSLPGLAIAQARWLLREHRRSDRRRAGLLDARPVSLDGALESALAPPPADPERDVVERERLERVTRILAEGPPRAREIFLAVYGGAGRRQAEVADALGISLQRVRQTLCEVRARLRRELSRAEEGSGPWST